MQIRGIHGGALSVTDILVAIYFDLINTGDKVVLSKGHASAALYAVLAEKGFFPKEELKTFRKINSRLQGHPSMLKTPGVDVSSRITWSRIIYCKSGLHLVLN